MARHKQRVKTGCFTCRRRKKKCGEESPICHRCNTSGYMCTWPSMLDLFDKRNRSEEHEDSLGYTKNSTKLCNVSWYRRNHEIINDCWNYSPVSSTFGTSRIEYELLHHFLQHFLPCLLSSFWNKVHYVEYQGHLMELIPRFQGVKYAVLASCASNKSMLTRKCQYQNLALRFYSHAVKEVNLALAEIYSKSLTPSDSLLVAVIYLYIHDLWGGDAGFDPTAHIYGAMALINLRLDKNSLLMSTMRAIDRVALESVFYQASLLSMKHMLNPIAFIDRSFVSRTERLLVNTISSSSSPILGLSLPLYRLISDIIELSSGSMRSMENERLRVAFELEMWEGLVFQQTIAEPGPQSREYHYGCFQNLHIIAASILFNWISGKKPLPITIKFPNITTSLAGNFLSARTPSWQIKRALTILDHPEIFESWTKSYIAAWPLFIFGLDTSSEEEASFIRNALLRLRDRVGYGLAQRTLDELELEWRSKWKS